MRAGQLRNRIVIEAPGATQNAYGEPVETWTTFLTTWAKREDLTGREALLASQTQAEVTTRFVTRYAEGVTAKMRITSDGQLYNVESVQDPEGRRRTLVIMAKRVS